jgi:hypothetical protein
VTGHARYASHQEMDWLATSAPCRRDFNFSHTIPFTTRLEPADVSKPQSVPAMTRAGSPT